MTCTTCSLRRFLLLLLIPYIAATWVPCVTDSDCHEALSVTTSACSEGYCTNPFYQGGCLKNFRPDWHRTRVCNSHDPPEAEEKGYCVPSEFDYTEIRALAQDWESALMSTWILQIVLSEVLGVPTSIETGLPGLDDNFYDLTSRLDYASVAVQDDMLTKADEVVDCRLARKDPDNYEACANVILEAWLTTGDQYPPSVERPTNFGVLGEEHWFIPKFTAERDPSLSIHFGLAGEENRRKLAETFLRPTTWIDYCSKVSLDGCATDDGIASRAPSDETEGASFFVSGNYTGHFRATEENNCDTYPDTCTGHFVDYPCHWNSHFKQQANNLNIALKSSGVDGNEGYDYTQMTQIWDAAAATRSDVMMLWWMPETTYELFQGTDAEMTQVLLPPPTEACLEVRVDAGVKCGDNETEKIGDPAGVCDWPTLSLKKLVTSSLQGASSLPRENPALWNPAYDFVSNMELSNLQYSNLFQRWFDVGLDGWNYDLRAATCSWVVDNLDILETFIPEAHPRTVVEVDTSGSAWFMAAGISTAVAIFLVLVCTVSSYMHRNSMVMHYTQMEFLVLLVAGLALVCGSCVIFILQQSTLTCTVGPWFEGIGNTIVAVVLGVRVRAISKLHAAGKHMKHVRLRTKKLFLLVGAMVGCAIVLLLVWTIAGAPEKRVEYILSNKLNIYGERIVHADYMCTTRTDLFEFLSVSWQAMLLVPTFVVAVSMGGVKDVNDTKSLESVLAERVVIITCRFVGVIVFEENMLSDYLAFSSFILGLDSIATMLLYIVPKFLKKEDDLSKLMMPDVFLNTTVAVASIDGFTAWSSVREPIQVFQLLDILFESFDEIAERHKIFKAETSASFLVVASGVPDTRSDHAVAMAKYASDCIKKMNYLTKKMETQFGPDTADLGLRIAIDSGAITGGYTYGKKDSFQLFGDTMTTARQLHESGKLGEILLSEATAELLVKAGKKHWIAKIDTKILSSHKGELQAYWLTRHKRHHGGPGEGFSSNGSDEEEEFNDADIDSETRWIEWNTRTLQTLLEKVVASHHAIRKHPALNVSSHGFQQRKKHSSDMPLEEVQEIIEMPEFDKEAVRRFQERNEQREIAGEVSIQLHDFVSQIASMYRNNAFHNFGHASYVVMAVTKYLNRINAAKELDVGFDADRLRSSTHAAMHDHTYGITSDPLTHFACVFSALIHDVDHPGVPNPQLIKENERLATIYKNRSVAEQRSFDLAWDLFMDPSFNLLRHALCPAEEELLRFRQLVINSVMATDLGDKVLKELRNNRWAAAFDEGAKDVNTKRGTNRKATIVIEHLIQAADVAHTCQHWCIYRKWNERLFRESYEAYLAGRSAKNPAEYWYEGELGFFDFYIIPLSRKLRDCGVFGSTSDENLNYALNNRAMWEKDGRDIVAQMLENAHQEAIMKVNPSTSRTGTLTTQSARTAEETIASNIADDAV